MRIAEHLHLDMAGRGDPLLQQHLVIAEAGLGLAAAGVEARGEVCGRIDLAHPLAAAARDRLDQDGIPDRLGLGSEAFKRLVRAEIAGRDGNTRLDHARLGRVLQAHRADARRLRPDPDEASIKHGLREVGILRQEPVPGVNRIRPRRLRRRDDLRADQITLGCRRGADMHALVSDTHMQRLGIGIGIDRDGRNAHRARGADNAAGNLAAIGDQEFGYHCAAPQPVARWL